MRLSDILGHSHQINLLRQATRHHRLGHAYLFHGPEGIGKASLARAWLATLFCRQSREDACGQCPPCRRLAANSHPDWVTLVKEDGKTRISVDQVREMTRFLSLSPMEAGWKVVLMDDAADMNENAANALLKTLEEPGERTLLLLVTNRLGMLPATIRSRCQKIAFQPLEQREVEEILKRQSEKVNPEELRVAARLAEGSVARALSLQNGELAATDLELQKLLSDLPRASLADLLQTAAAIGPDRFLPAMGILSAWLRQRIRDSVQDPKVSASAAQPWMELLDRQSELVQKAREFNLNRLLALESLLIRLWRIHQA